MACPNCGETLQGLGMHEDGRRYFWCHRCGTLKCVPRPAIREEFSDDECTDTPKLVETARECVPILYRYAVLLETYMEPGSDKVMALKAALAERCQVPQAREQGSE